MAGALDRADTTVTVEEDKAAGTGLHAHCLLLSLSALPWWRRIGAVGGGVGRRTAPGWPRWAVKETVHTPSLVSRWREAMHPQAQAWRNSITAAWTLSRLDILASDSEACHSETGWPGFLK